MHFFEDDAYSSGSLSDLISEISDITVELPVSLSELVDGTFISAEVCENAKKNHI